MKLYNTLTRNNDEFSPTGKKVKIYTCGLTVYSQPHIGNWVGYIYWDVLVRLLRYQGYQVIRTQNITDVGHLTSDDDSGEDKMEKGAQLEGLTAWDVAKKYSQIAECEAYDLLQLVRPDYLSPATEFIEQQVEFAKQLSSKGYTYIIPGDGLYFDTSKLSDYGKLAQLDVAGLEAGARVSVEGKKNITDFAVWKFSPVNAQRDMEWDSPWGVGFPGWHLECSVIARETLGDTIDIHTGGIDHIPVHHTNEIAQTESLTGQQFAKVWLHNNHIKVDGKKMSKSLGNIVTLDDIMQRDLPVMSFKLLVLSKNYQTEGNFTWDNLEAANNRLNHWYDYAGIRHQIHSGLHADNSRVSRDEGLSFMAAKHALIEALSNNLDTAKAVALVDETFSQIDQTRTDDIHRQSLVEYLQTIDELLGLDLIDHTPDISDNAKQLIVARERARDSKDWAKSDTIRDELLHQNIAIRDTPSGTIWSRPR